MKKLVLSTLVLAVLLVFCRQSETVPKTGAKPAMMFADSSRGEPFAKDPDVAWYKGRYLLYYTMRPFRDGRENDGYGIGIAESSDLTHWQKIAELPPAHDYESKGICAPGAIVLNDTLHLFYQTYGNREKDAICHAWSVDGIHFTRNESNPIFAPHGDWTIGRAIDADAFAWQDKLLLYFATRDTSYTYQIQGVAAAPLNSNYGRNSWKQLTDYPILVPKLDWEKTCIEAATVFEHNEKLYMFYAGAYNNQPQQIGCAVSRDGIKWKRLSQSPILPNGNPGDWNASESGHPGVFVDRDGQIYLFFQGNNDNGKTWYLSKKRVTWNGDMPVLVD